MSGERWEQVLEQHYHERAEELQGELNAQYQKAIDRITDSSESPIERILAATFTTLGPTRGHNGSFHFTGCEISSSEFSVRLEALSQAMTPEAPTSVYGDWTGLFASQVSHGPYRLDFLFGAVLYDEIGPRAQCLLAVECDGHAYHERTKEQAAHDRTRDRALQADGLAVFRFTGSQLYNDPLGCAAEIYSFMDAWASPHRKSIQARVRGVPA